MYERYQLDVEAVHQRDRTGPCFVCAIVARTPAYPAHLVYEDATSIAFLDTYPMLYGYTLVAPKEHREQVTADFTIEAYLELQRKVYQVTEAVQQEVGAERVYMFSFGRNQGNAHVHWHVAPLPAGMPYEEQGSAIFDQGVLRIPEEDQAALAARLRQRLEQLLGA